MSSGHKVIAAASVGLAVIVVLIATRGGCGTESATPGSETSVSGPKAAGPTTSRPTRPTLPEQVRADSGVTISPAAQFAEEGRDVSWADGVEKRLRTAIDGFRIDGASVGVGCRSAICRLELTGELAAIVEMADRLGEAPEVITTSESVSLSRAPNPAGEGEPIVFVYLRFRR